MLWLEVVKDFWGVRCRLALRRFLISSWSWVEWVASLQRVRGGAHEILVLLRYLGLVRGGVLGVLRDRGGWWGAARRP